MSAAARIGWTPRRSRMGVAWAIALATGAGMFALAGYAARTLPRPSPLAELAYYPSGQFLEPATLGHAETAADLAWLKSVQYYGEHRHTDNRFESLYHVFDILTTLAPRFQAAYVFGAFALAQEGFDFPRAEQLMRKGLDANPRSGPLAFELGFLYYVRPGGRDLRKAAAAFELAARLPGGPPESARFAAFSRQNSGDLAVAYELWSQVERTTANAYLRDIASKQMRDIREALAGGRKSLAIRHMTTPIVLIRKQP